MLDIYTCIIPALSSVILYLTYIFMILTLETHVTCIILST